MGKGSGDPKQDVQATGMALLNVTDAQDGNACVDLPADSSPAFQRSDAHEVLATRGIDAPAEQEQVLPLLGGQSIQFHQADPALTPGRVQASSAAPMNRAVRPTVERLGANAAVIVYERLFPVLRRIVYLVGFDQFEPDPAQTRRLLILADACWGLLTDQTFLQASRQALEDMLEAQVSASGEAAGDEPPAAVCDPLPVCELPSEFGEMAFAMSAPGGDHRLKIALFRNADRGAFPAGLGSLLDLVEPGLSELAGMQMDVQRAHSRVGILEGMLDSISHGVVLLNPQGRPFYVNDVAQALIRQTGALGIGNDHVLRCRSADLTRTLHQAIREADGSESGTDEVVVKLECDDGSQLLGFLLPVSGRDQVARNRAVILLIHEMKIHAASPALMRAFGLLPSEQRFLAGFLEAPSLTDAAARLQLSEETARTYLKRVCSKLGVRRQVELASLLFGLTPQIRRRSFAESGAILTQTSC